MVIMTHLIRLYPFVAIGGASIEFLRFIIKFILPAKLRAARGIRYKITAALVLPHWGQQTQSSDVAYSPKCYLYKEFKKELKFESYLHKLPANLRTNLTKFRLCNHKLPIETGRHRNIDRKFRLWTHCDKKDLGDEYHYICVCSKFDEVRKLFVPINLIRKPSVLSYCDLVKTSSKKQQTKLAKFVHIIMKNIMS